MRHALRRHLLQSAIAGVVVLASPAAIAQWGGAFIKWLNAIGAIEAGISIGIYVRKWFQDNKCNITLNELEDLKLQCQTVANSLDYENSGAIHLLKIYLSEKDKTSWIRAKIALAAFFNNGSGLMSSVNVIITKLDPKTYPGPQEDIQKLYQGIDKIRAAVSHLASLPDDPGPETVEMATEILKEILGLPDQARTASKELQGAVDDRRKVACS